MLQIVLYSLLGIILYLVTNWLVNFMEQLRGQVLPYRSIIFFVIIFALANTAFFLVRITVGE